MIETIRRKLKLRQPPARKIWRFQETLSKRLLWWAGLNIILGVWLQQRQNKFWRGVGMQSVSWGAINALIALVGNGVTQARRANIKNPNATEVVRKEHRNLLRILWVNTVLDVFYILGGVVLALTRGSRDRLMRGNGWGIVLQGGFLMVFDAVHAIIMSSDDEES